MVPPQVPLENALTRDIYRGNLLAYPRASTSNCSSASTLPEIGLHIERVFEHVVWKAICLLHIGCKYISKRFS